VMSACSSGGLLVRYSGLADHGRIVLQFLCYRGFAK
jgi:hypothetical protein